MAFWLADVLTLGVVVFFSQVNELGGVPTLIAEGEMSNTIPDQKVTSTFLVYLCGRLLNLSQEITAARKIQLAWKKYRADREAEKLKVKYTLQND